MMKIGKYEILEEIGRGAMGVVHKAFDPLIGREVAIKVISESALAQPEIKERFYREARSVGKLNHKNITIVHDVGEVDGKPYLVMEYLAGTDLKLIIREKAPVRLLQKLEYARQICKGLQYAHSHHVIHRDIKPENIKISPDGNIKIMDFGIARPTGSDLTAPGMMLGTPSYMSPEQIKGKTVDIRTDIFSFGIVLYELLLYKKPFEGNVSTVIYSILHNEPAPINLGESYLVADIQNLLAKCLAKNVEDRYRDCAALLKDLDIILAKGRQQEQKIVGLFAQARALIAQQKFREAMAPLEEILLIDSTSKEAQSLQQECVEKTKTSAATPGVSENKAGTIISRYKIVARLGAGGMGVVYKAEDTRLKRLVALKFLSPHLTTDTIAKERFIREAQAASALDHPNICTIYEIDETAASPDLQFTQGLGQFFICMAYYEGQTLKEMMGGGVLPLSQTMNIAVQIAQGLAKAHENGIVHRDIKPANIMVTKDGLVKILDFGLAKLTGETGLTRPGVTAGTLSYLSPEQAQNQEVDHRSDIWSLGVMLYQMTTGKLPFDGEYDLAILYSIVHETPVPALQLNSNIPTELDQVISRALQKPLNDRYDSMQRMLDDLKRAKRRADKIKEHGTAPLLEEVGSLIAKGKFFLEKNEYPDALSRFKAALAIDAKNREVIELMAVCERKQKEAQQISKWLDTAKKQFEKGAYEDSLTAVQTILTLDPNHAEAHDWVKKNQQCLEQSEKVEKLFSDAEFYLKKEKFIQAREVYQEILRLEPANKNAARGLERAEKGLQARKVEAKPPQFTLPEPIDQTPTLFKLKSSSQGLWIGLVAVLLIGMVGAWFLWLRPSPPAQQVPGETQPDFFQKAVADAKQEMLTAKNEAQQAGAERWALNTYQQGVDDEQKGDEALAGRNWNAASQAYKAAVENYKKAANEAQSYAALTEANLNKLKESVAQTKDEMLREKAAAEKAGARTKAKAFFDQAIKKEQEGSRNFEVVDNRNGNLEAQKLFGEARDKYKQAKDEALTLIKSTDAAEAARREMLAAKQTVPGDEAARNTSANYTKADETANLGDQQFRVANYDGAYSSFQQAKELYSAAAIELEKKPSKTRAVAAQKSMLEARAKVDKSSQGEAKYREAEQIRNEGDQAYQAENFDGAAERYANANDLYLALANEAKAKQIKQADWQAKAQGEIQTLINRLKTSIELSDLKELKAVYGRSFMKDDEKAWSAFFKIAKNIRVSIESEDLSINGGNAQIDLVIHINYRNNKNEEVPPTTSSERWLLEQNNGVWVISQRTSL